MENRLRACTTLSTSGRVFEKIIKSPFLFKISLLLVSNVNLNQIQCNPTFLVSQLDCCTHGRKNRYNHSIQVPENDKTPTKHLLKAFKTFEKMARLHSRKHKIRYFRVSRLICLIFRLKIGTRIPHRSQFMTCRGIVYPELILNMKEHF